MTTSATSNHAGPTNPIGTRSKMLQAAARQLGLAWTKLAGGYACQFKHQATGQTALAWASSLPGMAYASVCICQDKAACSELLLKEAIPTVSHIMVSCRMNWRNYVLGSKADDQTGCWQRCARELANVQADGGNEGLVLKPCKGSSGETIFRIRKEEDIDEILTTIPRDLADDLVVSPFVSFEEEYRLIIVLGRVGLCYVKRRAKLVGDGRSTLQCLLASFLKSTAVQPSPQSIKQAFAQMDGGSKHVLPRGESLLLDWRHNLDLGAVPILIDVDDLLVTSFLGPLALQAIAAVGLGTFVAVDIIRIGRDVATAHFKVLEINPTPQWRKFLTHYPMQHSYVQEMITDVVAAAFPDVDLRSNASSRIHNSSSGESESPSAIAQKKQRTS